MKQISLSPLLVSLLALFFCGVTSLQQLSAFTPPESAVVTPSNSPSREQTPAQGDHSPEPLSDGVDGLIPQADSLEALHITPQVSPGQNPPRRVYVFAIREEIMPATKRLVDKCLKEAREMEADLILIQMNTYGGLAGVADSIRTALLNSPTPVWVFIDNEAASAGALIAIAADSIYIRPGGSIGAASVVDAGGTPVSDKYQSFMRSMMRSTAEAHGQRIDRITPAGDTLWRWHRDPAVAEAMVGRSQGDTTTIGVLTLTADEALLHHYAEGKANTLEEVLAQGGVEHYTLVEYRVTVLDRLIGWLTHPAVQGVFILMIVGGIYFELQSPGALFPLAISLLGALLYFAPLYIEGVAQYWEVILFVVGIILLMLEILVIPGFGVAGVAGIVCIVLGLSAAAIDKELFRYLPSGQVSILTILQPVLVVVISATVGVIGALWLSREFLVGDSPLRQRVVLTTDLTDEAGYVGYTPLDPALVGQEGVVSAVLRPAGKVLIGDTYYEAIAQNGLFVEKGKLVRVVKIEAGVLCCEQQGEPGTDA